MTVKEAIEILENGGWWELLVPITTVKGRSDEDKLHRAIDMAITALHFMSEAKEPLTVEQLREMDGKPVWIEDVNRWGLVFIPEVGQFKNSPFVLFRKEGVQFEWQIEDSELTVYPYPPTHIDRSKWEPCERCKSAEYPPEKFGAHQFPVVGNEIYFYDTEYGWEGEEIKHCPWCGRPLTEEAWAELEQRIGLIKFEKED